MGEQLRLDHVSVLVRDVDISAAFYRDMLLLPEIPCKVGRPRIRWFGVGEAQSIHLIEGEFGDTRVKMSTHFCLSTDRYDAMKRHFEAKAIPFFNSSGEAGQENRRFADGVRQLYIQDPDQYWVELNDDCPQQPD
jgi:catechol 2,3-dioxygenase-like lactoylglutathione lyase family enzyme